MERNLDFIRYDCVLYYIECEEIQN